MKVNEICKVGFSRPVFNDVIDGRGFVKTPPYQDVCSGKKLGSQPLSNNAQTAPSSVSGQGRRLNVAQPLKPSIK